MERIDIVEKAINTFRGGSNRDLANRIDMAISLFQDVEGDRAAYVQTPVAVTLQARPVPSVKIPPSALGREQVEQLDWNDKSKIALGASVLGTPPESVPVEEEGLDELTDRLKTIPQKISIVPDGWTRPMDCDVFVEKVESTLPGGRQPCVNIRFQWDTGDSKEVVCDNFVFPGKKQSTDSILKEMVGRVMCIFKKRSTPIVAKVQAFEKNPVNAGSV